MIRKIFYILKPVIPRSVQIYLRQMLVKKQMKRYKNIWPVLPGSEKKPSGWKGWKDDKKFAFVLTHDVELQAGHDKCKELLEIEKKLGFKSSFNFVPERYHVSEELRKYIAENGFEVGVHGLNHDGKLFSNKKTFDLRSKKINNYLKEWSAVGFRAPAMHHNLDWLKQLNIEYDLSTFDTDPFEPQADGVGTIFPFIVERSNEDDSYVELPYTLVQDFTLFILMNENQLNIWKDKTDWIVKNGGLVLVNIHPDYINFNDFKGRKEEFSINLYIEFLNYIKSKYNNEYWHALPRDIANYVKQIQREKKVDLKLEKVV
ncbi:hypothetical protein LJE82_15780 [bacterium BMS3Abin03]|nr:hypothetical protein [bacterium BMS3Abin03]